MKSKRANSLVRTLTSICQPIHHVHLNLPLSSLSRIVYRLLVQSTLCSQHRPYDQDAVTRC